MGCINYLEKGFLIKYFEGCELCCYNCFFHTVKFL